MDISDLITRTNSLKKIYFKPNSNALFCLDLIMYILRRSKSLDNSALCFDRHILWGSCFGYPFWRYAIYMPIMLWCFTCMKFMDVWWIMLCLVSLWNMLCSVFYLHFMEQYEMYYAVWSHRGCKWKYGIMIHFS